jgi:hypothetical protein
MMSIQERHFLRWNRLVLSLSLEAIVIGFPGERMDGREMEWSGYREMRRCWTSPMLSMALVMKTAASLRMSVPDTATKAPHDALAEEHHHLVEVV